MFEAFVITLREGLEAFLIVAVSHAYVKRTGLRRLGSAIYWGLAAGIAVSVVAGVALYRASNREWLDGPLAIIAAVVVVPLLVHMWRSGRRLNGHIAERLSLSAERTAFGAWLSVWLLTVLMIGREGMETALLLLQIRDTMPLVVGAAAGIVAAAAIGLLSIRFGLRLNLPVFFQTTTIFLSVFLMQLSIKGVHEMAEQRELPYSDTIHRLTESWGPDSAVGHMLTYLLILLPLAWALIAWHRSRRFSRPEQDRPLAPIH